MREYWIDKEAKEKISENTAGILIADNGKELLILSDIVTAKEGEHIEVGFPDGSSCAAVEKMKDSNLGLGVYAVLRDNINKAAWSQIKTAEIGSSNSIKNGDTVIILGRPYGVDEASGYGVVTMDEEYIERQLR